VGTPSKFIQYGGLAKALVRYKRPHTKEKRDRICSDLPGLEAKLPIGGAHGWKKPEGSPPASFEGRRVLVNQVYGLRTPSWAAKHPKWLSNMLTKQ